MSCRSVIAVILCVASLGAAADSVLNKSLNEEIVFIPDKSAYFGATLETTFFRPSGSGPFPLVVINHGKEAGNPRFQPRARYLIAAREFVRRGYAVMVPMRNGFSRSSGHYISSGCNIESNGLMQAKDVRVALDYAKELAYVDAGRVLVMGQSHGGLTTLALGADPYPGVLGLVNFAGGLRTNTCAAWERSLVAAFAAYGEKSRLPTLWFYGDNDSYWSKETSAAMFSAYVGAGGKARMVAFGTFKGSDAHGMFGHRDGLAIWWPEVEKFLLELGLPTQRVPRTETNDPVSFRLQAAAATLNLSERCRTLFRTFLDVDYPRAFAVSETSCGYAYGGDNPKQRALDLCRGKNDAQCRLFVVDDGTVEVQ